MKKIWGWIVGVVVVIAIGAYLIWNSVSSVNPAPAPSAANNGGDGDTVTPAGTPTSSGTTGGVGVGVGGGVNASGSMTGMPMGQYSDGTYTGSLADAIYGKLQLDVTISGGMITNITWPTYPNTAGHTIQVNQSALPQLEQEAIASQNANVNIVSGATQTSEAFQQSLAAALAQAKS